MQNSDLRTRGITQSRQKALFGAFITSAVVNIVGVVFFFEPIARRDPPGVALVHPAVNLLVYVGLTVALFDWTARQMRSAYKAAFVVAAAQMLLVNVDYVLSGKRGVVTAGASTVLMLVTWLSVAAVYSRFVRWEDQPKTDGEK